MWLTLGLALDLVFSAFAAAVALDVMRFGLSGVPAVLTLLDWSTLGGNMLERAVCGGQGQRRRPTSYAGGRTYRYVCSCSRDGLLRTIRKQISRR